MSGIRSRFGSGGDDPVVARQLAFDARPPGDPPYRWMKPVHRADDGRRAVSQVIVSSDVRQLVKQDSAAPVARPHVGDRGDDNRRPPGTEGHRHVTLAASKQPHRAADAQLGGARVQQSDPIRLTDIRGHASQTPDAPALQRQEYEQAAGNDPVHAREYDVPRDRKSR
jgi:hypothetical protein